jgi:aquaporin Z
MPERQRKISFYSHYTKELPMRAYVMELLGTFLLTFFIAFSGEPTVVGLVLMALVYLGIHISGAHYNPAVTTAAFIRGKIEVQRGLIYMGMQVAGATVAFWVHNMVTANMWGGDLMPADGSVAFGMELLLASILCLVILTVGMGSRYRGGMVHGLVIGFTFVALVGMGGVMNPAIAVGALVEGSLSGIPVLQDIPSLLAYIVAPLVAGVGSAYLYNYLNPDDR